MSSRSSRSFTGRPSPALVLIILTVCAVAVVAVIAMLRAMIIPPQSDLQTTAPPAVTTAPTTTDSPAVTGESGTTDTTTTAVTPGDTTAPDAAITAEPITEPLPPVITLPAVDTPAKEDYFSSVLFIGDSRTQGLQIATGGYGAAFYADRGLASAGIANKKFIVQKQPDGSSTTISILDALTAEPHKGHIYLWLGINELAVPSSDTFKNDFTRQLDAIKAACPEADIVIMSLLPVGRRASVYGMPSNAEVNARVKTYNEILLAIAEQAGVYFLNCYESFADAEGYLPDNYASDGIHLLREQNLAICEYILRHPVPQT